MMPPYTMIVVIFYGALSSSTTIEFGSKDTCETAGRAIAEKWKEDGLPAFNGKVWYACFPRGELRP